MTAGPWAAGSNATTVFWAATRTKLDACRELNGAGVAVGPCHSVAELFADEHVHSHNMLVEMPRTDGVDQPIVTPGNPIKLSRMAEGPERRVPWLAARSFRFGNMA